MLVTIHLQEQLLHRPMLNPEEGKVIWLTERTCLATRATPQQAEVTYLYLRKTEVNKQLALFVDYDLRCQIILSVGCVGRLSSHVHAFNAIISVCIESIDVLQAVNHNLQYFNDLLFIQYILDSINFLFSFPCETF